MVSVNVLHLKEEKHTSQYMPLMKAATWAEAPEARSRVVGIDQYIVTYTKQGVDLVENRVGEAKDEAYRDTVGIYKLDQDRGCHQAWGKQFS